MLPNKLTCVTCPESCALEAILVHDDLSMGHFFVVASLGRPDWKADSVLAARWGLRMVVCSPEFSQYYQERAEFLPMPRGFLLSVGMQEE